jgi:thymidylate synthase
MQPIAYQSIDEAQLAIFDYLLAHGEQNSPRGLPTIETRAVSFTILDPRRRCVLNPARKWSLPLALGETCWHLSGSTAASDLAYYAPIWDSFADSDGQIRGSCYGSKMFIEVSGLSPWERVLRLLKADRDTRRAVFYFNERLSHLSLDCLDAACATSLQFLVRGGKLHALVCMRSNDAIWGLPYDVFLFTFLQELMAVCLEIPLGCYQHFTSSLHIYNRHIGLASRVVESGLPGSFSMPPLQDPETLPTFLTAEKTIRTERAPHLLPDLSSYWRSLAQVLLLFRKSRDVGWASVMQSTSNLTEYVPVLKPLLEQVAAMPKSA